MAFDRIPGVTPEGELPDLVRGRLAVNLANPSTPEGQALNRTIEAAVGPALQDAASRIPVAQRPLSLILAQRDKRPVRIVMMGSSTPEGSQATQILDRYLDQLGIRLNSRVHNPLPYFTRFVPARYVTPTLPDPILVGTTEEVAAWYGPGGRDVRLQGANSSITWTVTGRRVRFMHIVGPSSGAAAPVVTVDGGTPTPLASSWNAAALAVAQFTPWIDLGTHGNHTVKLSPGVAGQFITVSGVEVSQVATDADEYGIQMWDFSRSGTDVPDWLVTASDRLKHQQAGMAAINPDIIIASGFGSNLYNGQTVTPSYVTTLVGNLLDAYSAGSPQWLFVSQHERALANAAPDKTYGHYVAAVKAAADARRFPFLDIRAYLPPAGNDPLGIYPDGVHVSPAAHAWYGDIVSEWMMQQSTVPVSYP